MRNPMAAVVLAAAAAFAAPAALAKDSVQDLLAQAKEKARGAEPAKAAALYGDAFAQVHKQGDLVVEQEVFDAFAEFLGKLPPVPEAASGGERAKGFDHPEALAIVLRKLDPKRCGAFISAPCLAGELLLVDVGRGTTDFLADAAAVLAANVKAGKAGIGIALTAKFAGALQGKDADLDQVMASAEAEGWTDLAMAAGIEKMARAAARADGAADAKAVIAKLASMVTPKEDRNLCIWMRATVQKRLKGAHEDWMAPLNDAITALGGHTASGAGGRGGAGMDAGEENITPLGRILRKSPRGSVLGTASRTKEGFELRVPWDPKFKGVLERQEGVKHLDEGGLTVSFFGWSACARLVDPVGNLGQPGEASSPDEGRAFYRLARGETWTLRSDGVVTVGK